MINRRILFLLFLAFLFGLFVALRKVPTSTPEIPHPVEMNQASPENPELTGKEPSPGSDAGTAGGTLPDLGGMALGSGTVLAEIPATGVTLQSLGEDFSAPSKPEDQGMGWPKTSGKLKDIQDQVKEIRDGIDEMTLDAVSSALNALPFVSAEPEEAQWHVSGGEIGLQVTIPVEDIRIGADADSTRD